MLLFLLMTVVVALVGGLLPALIAAVGRVLLLNYYFTPPLHTLTISETNNALALLVFILVAALVSSVVDLAARRTRQAARAARGSRGPWPTSPAACWAARTRSPQMLERVRETFGARRSVDAAASGTDERLGSRRQRRATRAPARRRPTTEVPAGERRSSSRCAGGLLEAEDQRLVGGVRGPGRRRARPRSGSARRPRGRAAGRGQQDAHRAARRRRPRPAHPARRGQGGRLQPAQRRRRPRRRGPRASCSSPPTSPWTGWPRWSTTCWT